MKHILMHMDEGGRALWGHRKTLTPSFWTHLGVSTAFGWWILFVPDVQEEMQLGVGSLAIDSFGTMARSGTKLILTCLLWFSMAQALRVAHHGTPAPGILAGFRWRYVRAVLALEVMWILAFLSGLLMLGVGLLYTLPIAFALYALVDPWLLRGQGVRVAFRRAVDHRATRIRWGFSSQRILLLVGLAGLAMDLGLYDHFHNLVVIPLGLIELFDNGVTAEWGAIMKGERIPFAVSLLLVPLNLAATTLGTMSLAHGALRAADDTEEMEEGTRIEGLLERLEAAQAA